MTRIDERDIMFSRMNLKPGTKQYGDYYSRNPDKKQQDDFLRLMPGLGEEGTPTYDAINSPIIDASFRFLADIKRFSEGEPVSKRVDISPEIASERIRGLAKYYGAKLVGVTKLTENHLYSHRGRMNESYGEEVHLSHKYAIAFAVEMDKDMIFQAPKAAEGIAVTKGYVDAALIGMILSYYIRQLGYDARNHMDGNYLVVAPLVARDAGLGEIGRMGLLLTQEFGPRVRLGVVTTDLPLVCDENKPIGLTELCNDCHLCASSCPGRAIPTGDMSEIDGELRWKINQEACYRNWRALGADCGICLAACPYSDGVPEELIEAIATSPDARECVLENYKERHGARARSKEAPGWLK